MARRVILSLVAWICLIHAGAAQTLTFPALTGRVVDEAGLLDASDRMALTDSLAQLEQKTTVQLVIVTLRSLQGTSIEDYGYQLGRRWQIGRKDTNSGALLITAPTERAVRIEVGYGLEGTLTDAMTRLIIESTILPRFKVGDFPGGIKNGTDEIIKLLSGDANAMKNGVARPAASNARGQNTDTPVWPAIVVGVAAVGLLIFCAVTGGGGGLCRVVLQMILVILLSGRGGSSRGKSRFSGGGGSFGGGGSSGRW